MTKFIWYVIPTMFYTSQNNYFGWNTLPRSDAELLADGITLLLVLLSQLVAQGEK